jgi:hypothetical protein
MSRKALNHPLSSDIDLKALSALGSLATDPNGFVLMEGMTRLSGPQGATELARQFRASPADVSDTLDRLISLGLVVAKGKAFAATKNAIAAMAFLREILENEESEIPLSENASSAIVVMPAREIGEPVLAAASTNNGVWHSSRAAWTEMSSERPTSVPSTSPPTTVEDRTEPKVHAPSVHVSL